MKVGYSVREFAELWQVNEATVRRWIQHGQLRAARPSPRTTRIPLDAAREFEEASTISPRALAYARSRKRRAQPV